MIKNTVSTVFIKIFISASLFFGLFLYACFGPSGIFKTMTIPEGRFVVIPKGASLSTIAEILEKENVVPSSVSFIASAVLSGNKGKLKPGEFAIPLTATSWDIADLIASGKTVIRKFTLIEGGSVNQVVKALNENPVLVGEISQIPEEGFLMPDTYLYSYGDDRQKILNQMEKSMMGFLDSLKQQIDSHGQIKTKNELITLASLVEKETALGAERPIVAAVYLNRLRIKMPLQCDPTVIYSLTKGEKLERSLTKTDLIVDSPYNTYKNKGLPIGAIGCPGKASILAVLKPVETKALYFVANGKGGHEFANSLDEHNNNVKQWRIHQKNMREIEMPETEVNEPSNVQAKPDEKNVQQTLYKPTQVSKKIKPKRLGHYSIKKKKRR